jgi:eukaryotic-like serine/threonine-protein kinase
MTSRWSRLESLYHQAAALPAAERARFLTDACQDDRALRAEVEAMLAHEDTEFLEDPIVPVAGVSDSGRSRPRLAPGTKLGTYEVGALLGAGGMGEVYRARDTRLDRTVAIKISAEKFSERFEREARAISALNHPHICTLYDVGPDYLVMEYIDGQPLAGPVPLEQALRYAIQIADALDTAHRKGIVRNSVSLLASRTQPGERRPVNSRLPG